jgi:phosphoglycolate phosphatase
MYAARLLRGGQGFQQNVFRIGRGKRGKAAAMQIRNRVGMSDRRDRDHLQDVDTFVFDCDGVIWKGDHLIPGAEEAIQKLRDLNKNIFFVTNNSTRSREGTKEKFDRFNLPVSTEEILTSSFAAALYLKKVGFLHERNLKQKVYVIGDVGIVQELAAAGITSVGARDHADKVVDFKADFVVDPEIGAVVAGLDIAINYYKLNYAQLCLNQDKDCMFVATNEDAAIHLTKSQLWPGAGAIVASITGCTGRKPVVVGKPASILIEHLIEECGHSPDRMLMIGDRLETDILFGREHGMKTCLTMSGVTTQDILDHRDNTIIPDIIVNSIADLPLLLRDH